MHQKLRFTAIVALGLSVSVAQLVAQATAPTGTNMPNMQTPAPAPAPAPAAAPTGVQFYGWVEAGATFGSRQPKDRQNFGRLFDDRANEVLLNQVVYTAEKNPGSNAAEFDWGFKLQGMVGSDARFIHSVGLLDKVGSQMIQPDVVEAFLKLHIPGLTEGGTDAKVGKFVTLEGAETIDPRTMPFYSHTYIFNFGIPFNHTGVLATLHATKEYDLMFGVTRGVNTSLSDNNSRPAFHGGIGFNLGKLVGALTTHFGPETPHDNKNYRWLHDLTWTYALTDKQSLITDINHITDDAAKAKGYGIVQYYTQTLSDTLSWGIRGEIWRDANGFYVAQFANNADPIRFLRGDTFTPDPRTVGGGSTTYTALTIGLHYNVPVSKPLAGFMLRPEIRYDNSSSTKAFVDSKHKDQVTFGIDAILTF